jgi:hypothetical protein
MNTVIEAAKELETALKTVAGVQEVLLDPGAMNLLPAIVIGPPELEWGAGGSSPTHARFPVYAVIDAGERAMERLALLAPDVAAAVDDLTPGAVLTASPFAYPTGTTDLPSYQLIVEVGLQ